MANKSIGLKWGQLSNLKGVTITPGNILFAENNDNTAELYYDNENGTRKKIIDNDTPVYAPNVSINLANGVTGGLKTRDGKDFFPNILSSTIVRENGEYLDTILNQKARVYIKTWESGDI